MKVSSNLKYDGKIVHECTDMILQETQQWQQLFAISEGILYHIVCFSPETPVIHI